MLRFMFNKVFLCTLASLLSESVFGKEVANEVLKEVNQVILPLNEFAGMIFIAFSEKGKELIDVRGSEVRFWDWKTGKQIANFRHDGCLSCAALSADGKRLATGGDDKSVSLWETANRKERRILKGHPGKVFCLHFSPDGKWLAAGCFGGAALIWDVATGRLETSIQADKSELVERVALIGDGKSLVTWVRKGGKTTLWDVKTGKKLRLFDNRAFFGGVSADGKSLLTFEGELVPFRGHPLFSVWDIATGEEKQIVFKSEDGPRRIMEAKLSANGNWVFVAEENDTIRLLEVRTGKEARVFKGNGSQASELIISNDEKTLCWRSRVGQLWEKEEVTIWDIGTAKKLSVWKCK